MKPLGIGLLGLGRWGRNYVKTLLALPECRLVAAADASAAARAQATQETGTATRGTLEELMSDPAIEALVIATPDRTHFSLAAAALAAGRDVLVEKPMALEPPEAEALAGQSEAGGRVLAVGHTAVYHPDFAALMDEVAAEPLDASRHASAVRTSSGYADGRSNPIQDLCPHDLAMAVLLLGAPVAARARCGRVGVEYEVRFQGNAQLSGRAEWHEPPHIRRFEVAGAEGRTELSEPVPEVGRSPFAVGLGGPCRTVRHSPLGRQCLDFIECCRTRRQPLSNGRLGVEVTRCLAALTASCADSSAWVPLAGLVHR
jgi:predicted dehydrogenase